MATTLYFRTLNANIYNTTNTAQCEFLSTTRGTSVFASNTNPLTANSVWTDGVAGPYLIFVSEPVDKQQNVSTGSISFNLWGWETAAQLNASLGANVFRWSANTGSETQILYLANTVELLTTSGVRTASGNPASNTVLLKGDRLLIRVITVAVGAYGGSTGRYASFVYDGPTAAANGDSYMTFTDNFTFQRRIFTTV